MVETIIFNGEKLAKFRQQRLFKQIQALGAELPRPLRALAIYFQEDKGSVLYSQIKQRVAKQLGIEYQLKAFSLTSSLLEIANFVIKSLADRQYHGLIIQKPWRHYWQSQVLKEELARVFAGILTDQAISKLSCKQLFDRWWQTLIDLIPAELDIDGLRTDNLQHIAENTWFPDRVLPATCKAVMLALQSAPNLLPAFSEYPWQDVKIKEKKMSIIGISDLLGKPLAHLARVLGFEVQLVSRLQFNKLIDSGHYFLDQDVIVSATGVNGLINGRMIGKKSIVVDAGEPKGDVDLPSCLGIAAWITPVPRGIGPLTVISLMENLVQLAWVKNHLLI